MHVADRATGHHVGGGSYLPQATTQLPVPSDAGPGHPSLYFNAELSWLDFNWRVLYQAMDPAVPFVERLRFLAITENNLDEFVMKRVGGLKRMLDAGVVKPSVDGLAPIAQLDLVRAAARRMRDCLARVWQEDIQPQLGARLGIEVGTVEDLAPIEQEELRKIFRDRTYPILTPLAVDPGHPFPFLSNMSVSLAVTLEHKERGTQHFARVKVPLQDRWVRGTGTRVHVPIEEVVRAFVGELFPGMRVVRAALFRVTRNADVAKDEEVAEDLLKTISEELRERRFARVVRLEVEPSMSAEVRNYLQRQLQLDPEDLYEVPGMLDMSGFWELAAEGPWRQMYEPWEPKIPAEFVGESEEEHPDVFSIIRAGDVMVHHPYDSFSSTVQRFIEDAAQDPSVVAIKQTLYRTSAQSRIIEALVKAAEAGKAVAVLVEVTARFDEADNMEWASVLEEAGVNVTYGVVGLKTHAKVVLVVREEGDCIRTYCHVGTGNYNSDTAQIYADLGILTARPEIGRDAVNLFHSITGFAPDQSYDELIVAPNELRAAIITRLEREMGHVRDGREGRLVAKMNGLDDSEVIRALYRASQVGVEIDLLVRGQCRLRPGIPGFSDNIQVRSIVGRFLEHDRIVWWGNGGTPEVWIGSADWRSRNLDDRVEVVLPIRDPSLRARLWQSLDVALRDNATAWNLSADGTWNRAQRQPGEEPVDYQRELMARAQRRRLEAASASRGG